MSDKTTPWTGLETAYKFVRNTDHTLSPGFTVNISKLSESDEDKESESDELPLKIHKDEVFVGSIWSNCLLPEMSESPRGTNLGVVKVNFKPIP